MALTVTPIAATIFGNKRVKVVQITFDSSYLSGGEPLSKADLGLKSVDAVLHSQANAGYVASYDAVTELLHLYVTGAAANAVLNEVPSTTNVATVTVVLTAIGV